MRSLDGVKKKHNVRNQGLHFWSASLSYMLSLALKDVSACAPLERKVWERIKGGEGGQTDLRDMLSCAFGVSRRSRVPGL